MRYPYHDLYPQHFEKLVVEVCAELLGPGIQPFSSGEDGGRDARFFGSARCFPSPTKPFNGRFVIQAKHTEDPFAKFSDKDFSGPGKRATLSEEIPRIQRLAACSEVDHYLLFANRRLAGTADEAIRTRIQDETGVTTVELFSIERIERLLKQYPVIVVRADINELHAPLRVTPDDLAEVITALARQRKSFASVRDYQEIRRTSLARKNEINRLSPDFDKLIKRDYLKDFESVRRFLAHPDNEELLERYTDAACEFNDQILTHKNDFESLEYALVYLQRILFQRDGDLSRHKKQTKLVIYYMYWNCDIGEDDSTC